MKLEIQKQPTEIELLIVQITKQQLELNQLRKEFDEVMLKMRKQGLIEPIVNNNFGGALYVG